MLHPAPRRARCFALCLALMPLLALGQFTCDSTETAFGHPGAICGPSLITGQTFTAESTGWLHHLSVARCLASTTQIAIRLNPTGEDEWNEGILLGVSSPLLGTTGLISDCLPTETTASAYSYAQFDLTGIGVQEGKQYTLEFLEGYGKAGCSGNDYPGGHAFFSYTSGPSLDLLFEASVCAADIVFGCTDETACNFNPLAEAEDGTCTTIDCAGDCGGSAYILSGCTCIGGSTGLTAADCYGCTDPTACNYDSIPFVEGWFHPMIDDGSCATEDCANVCGGSAIATVECGCIGGNTGIPAGLCIDGCVTQNLGGDRTACSPYLMKGQSFTVPEFCQLKQATIAACCSSPIQFNIRKAPPGLECDAGNWNTGDIVYSSSSIANICQINENCGTPSGYKNRYWQPESLLLFPDETYVLELIQGYSVGACSSGLLPGTGFTDYGETASSMLFELDICTDFTDWGCGDPEATNWDWTATEHHPSFCTYTDCQGTDGGQALVIDGCGCVDPAQPEQFIQCPNGPNASLITNGDNPCTSRLQGQTWTAPENGYLTGFQCTADSTVELGLQLVVHDGHLADSVLYSTSLPPSTGTSCSEDNDTWRTFHFDSIPLQQGRQYRFEFTQGDAVAQCGNGYPDGHGLGIGFSTSNRDLLFHIAYQPDPLGQMNWACVDPAACNFDPTATHDGGECYVLDCNGDCNGSAILVEGCGCREGNTGIPAESCIGCTDASACNYNPVVADGITYPPLEDDGSCVYADCNGDCGGFAFESPTCGCIGGATQIDPGGCMELCQSTISISEFGQAPYYGSIAGPNSLQSFTLSDELYVTGIRLVQLFAQTEAFTIQIWQGDNAFDPTTATILDEFDSPTWTQAQHFGLTAYQLFFALDIPVDVQPGKALFIQLLDGNWASPKNPFDSYPFGASFFNQNSTSSQNDMAFEIITCTEIYGCTDEDACNYEPWATELEEGSCTGYCTDNRAANYTPIDEADLSCIANQYCDFHIGCMDTEACNYDAAAIMEVHAFDSNQAAVCAYPTPGTCEVCTGESDGTGTTSSGDTDGDGVCDVDEIPGCLVEEACNYNADATDPGECVFPNACVTCVEPSENEVGYALTAPDSDGDGLCDELDVCSDPLAFNFEANPSEPCVFRCDDLETPLVFHGIQLLQIPEGPDNPEGQIELLYEGGTGDSLTWMVTLIDLMPPYTEMHQPLASVVGSLSASMYSIHITDGYGCRGTLGEEPAGGAYDDINRPSAPDAIPEHFGVIQRSQPTQLRFAIPHTICD